MTAVANLKIDDGATAFTTDDYAIGELERLRLAVGREDGATGIPAWRVVLRHSRAWAVQTQDIDSAATAAAITFAATEWRTEVASDAGIQDQHLLAPQLEVDTLLVDAGAAATEAARLLGMFKVLRDRYRVTAHLSQGPGRRGRPGRHRQAVQPALWPFGRQGDDGDGPAVRSAGRPADPGPVGLRWRAAGMR